MISKKWAKVSQVVLGNREGKHCHWCKFIKHKDGSSYCENKLSKYFNRRVRTWDGDICDYFELDKWYTDDKNYDEYVKEG